MTWELICDNCGKTIPEDIYYHEDYIEYDYPINLIFCSEDCEDEYNRR